MKAMNERKYLLMILVAGLVFFGLAVSDVKAGDLPDPETVMEHYIKATGGKDNYEKHNSLKMTGTFAMPAMGITAPLTTYQKAPNLGYTIIASDAFGTIESGSNGEVLWEKTMMTGPKVKEGEEKAVADRQGAWNMLLRWKDFYTESNTVAVEEVEGQNCYKVVSTPKVGSDETSWLNVETSLLVKTSMSMTNEMGVISMDIYPSDYRDVDGVTVPFQVRQILMGMQEITITTETLEWDPEIPEGTFDVPEDVMALVK